MAKLLRLREEAPEHFKGWLKERHLSGFSKRKGRESRSGLVMYKGDGNGGEQDLGGKVLQDGCKWAPNESSLRKRLYYLKVINQGSNLAKLVLILCC